MKNTTETKSSLGVLEKKERERVNIDQQKLCNPKTDQEKNKESEQSVTEIWVTNILEGRGGKEEGEGTESRKKYSKK